MHADGHATVVYALHRGADVAQDKTDLKLCVGNGGNGLSFDKLNAPGHNYLAGFGGDFCWGGVPSIRRNTSSGLGSGGSGFLGVGIFRF